MSGRGKIRLLLVDDQPAVLRGLRMWLGLEPDLLIVGEAESSAQARSLIDSLRPDVVVMDVEMPGLGGLDAMALVHAMHPTLPVVVLSFHDDIETRVRARVAGAAAFVGKHELDPALLCTIRAVARRYGCLGG